MAGKTAKTGRKVEKMRGNHSAAAPQSHKTLGKKTPESPKIPLQLGCSVTQIRHFFKRTFFNLPLIFENNVKKATVWLHTLSVTCGDTSPRGRGFVRTGKVCKKLQKPLANFPEMWYNISRGKSAENRISASLAQSVRAPDC